MKLIKALSWVCFLAVAVLLISGSPALAGNEPPDAGATILPDEVWGVVVLICTLPLDENDYAVVRVKQIQGCDVVVEVYADPDWGAGCPDLNLGDPEGQIGNFSLGTTYHFFGIAGTPYIDTVRNFHQITEGSNTITTFDAKFKFWIPTP